MSFNKLLSAQRPAAPSDPRFKRVRRQWFILTSIFCLILAALSGPVLSQFDDSAVPVTVDFMDNTSESAVPVIVDGAFSSPDEQDMDAMGFNTGSLYRQFLDRSTNRFSAVVSRVAGASGYYMVATIASSRISPNSRYAPDQRAAVAAFNMTVNGAPRRVALHVVGGQSKRGGPLEYLLDTNGDGAPDTTAAKYGIIASAGFSSLVPGGTPYFVTEIAVPTAGKFTFLSGRMTTFFYTQDGTSLSISDGWVKTGETLASGGIGTIIRCDYVPIFITIEVSTAIDLQKQGEVPVKIIALSGLDLRTLDLDSVRLRDGGLPTDFVGATVDQPGSFYTEGAKSFKSNLRETGGGQSSLTVWFNTADLKSLGKFTPGSLKAALVCKTTDGKNLAGTVPVRFSSK